MKSFHICCVLAPFISPVYSAGSYDVVPFEQMTSPHRVIIGVPADDLLGTGKDSDRVKYRRNKIIEIVDDHVVRMADKTDSLEIESIQYAFVSSLEYAFTEIFPLHTKAGAKAVNLEEPLPTPAIRLTNIDKNEKMQPDWPILLADLPDELDRLVNDYERWQSLSTTVAKAEDGTMQLHSKNFIPALNRHSKLVTMFYAPWCHFSQLMLPKYSEATSIIEQAAKNGLISSKAIGMAKVNVDQEGELKMNFEISTYPTLKVITGNNKKAARRKDVTWNNELFPVTDFAGNLGSSADIASHVLAQHAWPRKLTHANLVSDENYDKELKETDPSLKSNISVPMRNFIEIVKLADGELKKASETYALRDKEYDEEEDGPAFEAKRAVTVLVVLPTDTHLQQRSQLTAKISETFAGNNKFIASVSADQVVSLISQLPGDFGTESDIKVVVEQQAASASGNGYVIVAKCEFSNLLFQEIPQAFHDKSPAQLKKSEADFFKWLTTASWPTIQRFDPSAAQGERIQNGPVKSLCILVGDEADFMFEDFKSSLELVSNKFNGFAHYLYADYSEKRLSGLLRSVGINENKEPVVVLVSMANEFQPQKVSGSKINVDSLSEMIESVKNILKDEL